MKNFRAFIGLVFILRLDIGIQTQPNVGKHCSSYTINDANVTWSRGRELCKNNSGDLASIETRGEWEYLKDIAQNLSKPGDGEWYIGLKKETNVWRWLSGNDNINVSEKGKWPWQSNEPNGDGDCVIMARNYPTGTYGHFNDLSCNTYKGYICKQRVDCNEISNEYVFDHSTLQPSATQGPVKSVTPKSLSTTTAKSKSSVARTTSFETDINNPSITTVAVTQIPTTIQSKPPGQEFTQTASTETRLKGNNPKVESTSNSGPSSNERQSKNNSTWIVVTVTLSAIVLLVILIVCLVRFTRRRRASTTEVGLDNYEEVFQPPGRSDDQVRLPVSCTDPAGHIDSSSAEQEVGTYETVGFVSSTENRQNEQATKKSISVNKVDSTKEYISDIKTQSPTSLEFNETLETYELIGIASGERNRPVYEVVNEHASEEFQEQGFHAQTESTGKRPKPAVEHDGPLEADGPRETCMTLDKEPSRTDDHVYAVVDKASKGFSAPTQPPVKHQKTVVEHGPLEADERLVTCGAAEDKRSKAIDDKDDVYAVVHKSRKTAKGPERGRSCAGLVYADLDLSQSPGNSAEPVRRNSRTVYSNIDHLQTARKSRLAEKDTDEESENTDV